MTKSMKVETLPQDLGAEAATLGSMIVDSNCIGEVLKAVTRDAFLHEEHRLIYDAVTDLFQRNGPEGVDGLLVRAKLESAGKLETIGGRNYLKQVMETVPSSACAKHYAGIVRERHLRRFAIIAAQKILNHAYDLTQDIDARIDEARASLSQLNGSQDGIRIKCLAEFAPDQPSYLIENMFVANGMTGIIGDPGVSKSYLCHCLAACISTGAALPGTVLRPPQGIVGIFSSEDSPPIIRYRIDRHGGDSSKIFIVSAVVDLRKKIGSVEAFIEQHPDCRAIIIDPISGNIGDANANSNSEVRAALGPLAELAVRRHVAIIAVNHLNKRQDLSFIYRGLGSTAFTAVARSVWAVIQDKDDEDLRILAPVKSNYSVKPVGLKYKIIDGAIQFEPDPWTGHVDDQAQPRRESKHRVEECSEWLKDRLAAGVVLSTTIFSEASEQGFNRDLCFRAKQQLGIRASKTGFEGGKWYWELPEESKNGI